MNTLMVDIIGELETFLENIHKECPSCAEAESYLTLAEIAQGKIQEIVDELEQAHNLCIGPQDTDEDDGFGLGV